MRLAASPAGSVVVVFLLGLTGRGFAQTPPAHFTNAPATLRAHSEPFDLRGDDVAVLLDDATTPVCGNDVVEGEEQCDDGNTVGGDGCAANCTGEEAVSCELGTGSTAVIQTKLFAIPLSLAGSQSWIVGGARAGDPDAVRPLVLRAGDLHIDPIPVPGLVCACLRALPAPEFGPGNAAAGTIGCADSGLPQVNYTYTIDHNINNVDPDCSTGILEDGSLHHPHAGVCNGQPTVTFTGQSGSGSASIETNAALSLIADGGACAPAGGDPILYGPDGIPCTDDDPEQAVPLIVPVTTGTAAAEVIDPSNVLGQRIGLGRQCGAVPCSVQITGRRVSCDELTTGMADATLVSATGFLDAAQIGDNVTTTQLVCGDGGLPNNTPVATPTSSPPPHTPTPTPTEPGLCGNGVVDGDEECDDGNFVGGDGCAANCTNETRRVCELAEAAGETIQTKLFGIPFNFRGRQFFTTGGVRTSDPERIIPVVIKASDVQIDPIPIPGLVCACLRAVVSPELGGNSAQGEIGCSANGLANIDYLSSIDHNIGVVGINGFTAADCAAEGGTVEDGSPAHPHVGVCNGPPMISFAGQGPAGSALVESRTSLSLILDGGACSSGGGDPALYGPDGIACTDDDPGQEEPNTLPITSGIATAEVLDASNVPGSFIRTNAQCGPLPCMTQITGSPATCAALLDNQTGGLGGLNLVSALASLDTPGINDNVTTTSFACNPYTPPTPTPTKTRTPTRSPTPTISRAMFTSTPTATPRSVHISIGSAQAGPGQRIAVTVSLLTSGAAVAATANDITVSDTSVFTIELETCRANPAIGKVLAKSVIAADPPAQHLRFFVQPGSSDAPIPDGPLYSCAVRLAPSALPGTYALGNGTDLAFDAAGGQVQPVIGDDGSIRVSLLAKTCPGDCSGDGHTSIDELLTGVHLTLSKGSVVDCLAFDTDENDEVTVDELTRGVNAALDGCP